MQLLPFHFPYTRTTGIHKITHEEVVRFYPFVPVKFNFKEKNTPEVHGLLDSGSDGNIIPLSAAKYLGLELKEDPLPISVVGRKVEQYKSRVSIIIGRGGRVNLPIDIEVSIPKEGDTPFIIGRSPVFELYRITFIEAEKRFTMDPYIGK